MSATQHRQEVVATYLAELPSDRPQEAAEAFATGQSIGTWLPVPGISPSMRRLHGARVIEIGRARPVGEVGGETMGDLWMLRVGFATENFGPQFPMLLTTLVGNDPSTSLSVRLVDLDLPETYQAGFPGPQLGIEGWRRTTGVQDRPLLLNMIKPCTGYSPRVGADLLEQPARGGADLIKDDELLADAPFNRVAERSRVYRERLERVAEETGHRARYIANVTDRATRLVDTARAAVDGGADAVMVNALAIGLDPFQALVESRLGVPILVHTATSEVMTGAVSSGIGQALLFGKFLRLAGADSVFTTTPYARRPPSRPIYEKTLEWMRGPAGNLRPTMPMLAGGVTRAMIGPLIRESGIDVILGVGGAIQGHPDGAEAGTRAIRAQIDEAMALLPPRTSR
ncbi:MAG: RuBisCO large subunit C-terminal-like domain-containing protein [Candidatus Limnocylindrales bacterium]|jgi:2,3-diketo-5-methylthiopentyl-1-phosphate enolase